MVPLGLWFVPGGQLCVIGGDLGVLVLGPAAMFAVLVVLAIMSIAGCLVPGIAAAVGGGAVGGSAAHGGDPQFLAGSRGVVAVGEVAAERSVGRWGAVVPGQGDDPGSAGVDLL